MTSAVASFFVSIVPSAVRRRARGQDRGQVIVIAALLLPLLLGMAGLAIDYGVGTAVRRNTQNAADAAALAGAGVIRDGGTATTARSTAFSLVQKNGYATSDATVNIPPTTGAHAGDSKYVEVTITRTNATTFMRVLGKTSITISSRAVAGSGAVAKNYALVVLDPTMCSAYNQSSGNSLTINGGGAIVDSSCQPSGSQGGGSSFTAQYIDYYNKGSWSLSNNASTSVAPTSVMAPVPDPLASLARPFPCGPVPTAGCIAASPDSAGTALSPTLSSFTKATTLHPGTYYGGIKISGNGLITFLPGTYIFAGGGLDYTASGGMTGSGVTFFNTSDPYATKKGAGDCAAIALQGGGAISLSGPTSGTYKNMLFWQDDACTVAMKLAGNGYTTAGVIYLPQAQLNVSGGGSLGALQIIIDSFQYTGSSAVTINYANYVPITPPSISLVE